MRLQGVSSKGDFLKNLNALPDKQKAKQTTAIQVDMFVYYHNISSSPVQQTTDQIENGVFCEKTVQAT